MISLTRNVGKYVTDMGYNVNQIYALCSLKALSDLDRVQRKPGQCLSNGAKF